MERETRGTHGVYGGGGHGGRVRERKRREYEGSAETFTGGGLRQLRLRLSHSSSPFASSHLFSHTLPAGFPFMAMPSQLILDPATVPTTIHDWFAVFNPHVPRVVDVDLDLSSNFTHDRSVYLFIDTIILRRLPLTVVCNVRFSPDDTRLAVALDDMVCLYDVTTRRQDMCVLSISPTAQCPLPTTLLDLGACIVCPLPTAMRTPKLLGEITFAQSPLVPMATSSLPVQRIS